MTFGDIFHVKKKEVATLEQFQCTIKVKKKKRALFPQEKGCFWPELLL